MLEQFLKDHCESKNLEPGTRQAYLVSLQNFCDFILSERPPGFVFENVQSMKSRLCLERCKY